MEAKTILQKRAVELSKTLQPLSDIQKTWARKNILKHVAFRTSANTKCLDCGAIWKTIGDADPKKLINSLVDTSCTCPECGTKLKVEDIKKLIMKQKMFYTTIEVVQEFQVVRLYEIQADHRAKQSASIYFMEVASQWILPNGQYELIARLRGSMGIDCWHGYLEIRGKQSFFEKYNIYADGIYPKMGILPIFKKHGFKGSFHGLTPHDLFTKLGHSSICETLMKRREFGFLTALCLGSDTRKKQVNKYWPSIKICMRHGFYVSDKWVTDYLDHLELLEFLGEDLNNPHFVCPDDFKAVKRRYIAKKSEYEAKQGIERQRAKIADENEAYVQQKGKFFGFEVQAGNIAISVIKSVQEVYEHGKILHHCVFSNGYHKKADSLLLCAVVAGELAETIEVDLKNMQITQARGLQNQPHKDHLAILDLLKKKLPEIKKKHKQVKTIAA